jgi:probable HAF family extracellular repeat protein
MRGTTQMMGRALVGALVLAWMATAGWSQSLTWLGTLPGGRTSIAYGVSADGSVVVGGAYNAAGQWRAFRWTALVGCKTSARWAAIIAGLWVFPPTAPWWSAGLTTPQGRRVPFAGRWMVGCKTSARWAAYSIGLWRFRRRRRGGRLG